MQKKFICLLISTLMMISILASCNRGPSNNIGTGKSTPELSVHEEFASNENSVSSSIDSNEGEQTVINQDVYLQAMEKWNKLGGNIYFRNIENVDTSTLVKIYSHYFMYTEQYRLIKTPDVWMDLTGFDRFVKDYFNLDPEQYHHNYSGASVNFDPEKGFRFYSHTSIFSNDAKYKMENQGSNGDGTYYFEELTIFELPKELLPEGESNIIKRTTIVTFEYVEEKIYFLKATYQQDGKML